MARLSAPASPNDTLDFDYALFARQVYQEASDQMTRVSISNFPVGAKNASMAAGLFACIAAAPPPASAQVPQTAVVFLQTECLYKNNAENHKRQGTGVVITQKGHLLTAEHVVTCPNRTSAKTGRKVRGILGHNTGSQIEVDVIKVNPDHDLAVMKFAGPDSTYDHIPACGPNEVPTGKAFFAFGYPFGQRYQPVAGVFGVQAGNGLWGSASAFDEGMSGGPVVVDGNVIGLIASGVPGVIALRRVTPLHLSNSIIKDVTKSDLPDCEKLGDFTVEITFKILGRSSPPRTRTTNRVGVSTGSLVDTKCSVFAFAPTPGWRIQTNTISIVDRIAEGSSRVSIVHRTDTQIKVEFCARSKLDGFRKRTGNSFGAVRFQERPASTGEETRTLKDTARRGVAIIDLPGNIKGLSGKISGPGLPSPIPFSSSTDIGRFVITVDTTRVIVRRN